ncbi:DUF6325 family protein [Microbacterium sp. M28]|uniref:DUF6325 family protein n=1 Tax=Microbacterium sp. M28 TaxID=2962064 RepID=UPI0021F4458F|nr:DUF6325 family protein [Microbacterium sp. M28]UYO97643.1 DUF6325 family protein [Microbacterium sp. M28]
MADLEFGPVEFVLAGFIGEEPDPVVIEAIAQLVDAGTVRLIDLLHVSRDLDGVVRWVEVDDAADRTRQHRARRVGPRRA